MRLVTLGLPGAGKGTQGELLEERFNVPHISTGKIIREAIRARTEMGIAAEARISQGFLVEDEVVNGIVLERLAAPDCRSGFILDGFPRNVAQAKMLDKRLPALGVALDAAIDIRISEAEAIHRIAERRVCEHCGATRRLSELAGEGPHHCRDCGGLIIRRPDDNEQTARTRLSVYQAETRPVLGYYQAHGKLVSIDGEGEIGSVLARIVGALTQAGVVESQR